MARASSVTRGVFLDCPQCRKTFTFDTHENIPKNILLANLIQTVNMSTKAACPTCKSTSDLIVCEHCSQIFCAECNDVILLWNKKTLKQFILKQIVSKNSFILKNC